MDGKRLEVMQHLEPAVQELIPEYLKAEEEYWQPSDMLPDVSSEEGFEGVRDLQAAARELPDDVLGRADWRHDHRRSVADLYSHWIGALGRR